MIWTIAKKEFLMNLMTFKFAVSTVVCVLLTAVYVPVVLKDYEQRLDNYRADVAHNAAELKKVKVYKNITPSVFKPPSVLSVFSQGIENQVAYAAQIEFSSVPCFQTESVQDNPFLSIFPALDVALLFKIVISILALLVAHDAVCGERQQGTLQLMLASAVPRYQVLLGKSVAGLFTLAIPVIAAMWVAVLLLELSPNVQINGSDWMRLLLILVASILFISVMYCVGLLLSCVTRQPGLSLLLALLGWIGCVVVIPNVATRVAICLSPIEPRTQADVRIQTLRQDYAANRGEYLRPIFARVLERRKTHPSRVVSGGKGAFGHGYAQLISLSYLEERIQRYTLPLDMEYADQIGQVEQNYTHQQLRQRRLSRALSRLSPVCLYENTLCYLARTDTDEHNRFLDQARRYRRQVIEYIRSHTNNFTAACLITACTEQDMIETGEYYLQYKQVRQTVETQAEKDELGRQWDQWRDKKTAKQPTLPLKDLASFDYQPSLLFSIESAMLDLGLLLIMGLCLWGITFWAFARYDIRMR